MNRFERSAALGCITLASRTPSRHAVSFSEPGLTTFRSNTVGQYDVIGKFRYHFGVPSQRPRQNLWPRYFGFLGFGASLG